MSNKLNDINSKRKLSNAEYFLSELVKTFNHSYNDIANDTGVDLKILLKISMGRLPVPGLSVFRKIMYFYYRNVYIKNKVPHLTDTVS